MRIGPGAVGTAGDAHRGDSAGGSGTTPPQTPSGQIGNVRAASPALAGLSPRRAPQARNVDTPAAAHIQPSAAVQDAHPPETSPVADQTHWSASAPAVDELTALGQAITARSGRRPPSHGGTSSAARHDGGLGLPGKQNNQPDMQSNVASMRKRQRISPAEVSMHSPELPPRSTFGAGSSTHACLSATAGLPTYDEQPDVFNVRRTPSDELFRLGESIRLRMVASSSAAATSHSGHPSGPSHDTTEPHASFHALEQGGRSVNHQSAPSANATSLASGSADFYYTHAGPLTESDRLPYRQLEALHQDLFSSREIQRVASKRGLQIGKVKDVDLNEFDVINATTGESTSIGTKALSTCIAICARGKNARGESILGLHHYDGRAGAEEALAELDARMKNQGALRNHYYLVGGMVLPEDSGLGSLPAEADLLSLRDRYDIRGAKLHVLEGEYDANGNENMLNVVVTPNDLFFSKRDLYQID